VVVKVSLVISGGRWEATGLWISANYILFGSRWAKLPQACRRRPSQMAGSQRQLVGAGEVERAEMTTYRPGLIA